MKSMLLAVSAIALLTGVAAQAASPNDINNNLREEFQENEVMDFQQSFGTDFAGAAREANTPGGGGSGFTTVQGFQGLSQYDVGAFGRGFVPPDTMGAVGTTQYATFVNGGVGIYNKSDGSVVSKMSDLAFWAAAGQTGASGDSRVQFDKSSGRWIALAFGASVSDIQIAVSDTSNAAGTWKSTKFTGFAGGTADYPTLAIDRNAVYIGTNNFANQVVNGTTFRGTTLNIIPLSSLFNATTPTTNGRATITTVYDPFTGGFDGGFAIQGVNSQANTTTGRIQADSLFFADTLRKDISNVGTPSQAVVAAYYVGTKDFDGNGPGRQPNAVPDVDINTADGITNNNRVVDTLDSRYGSSIFEQDGRIYSVHTVTPTGGAFTVLRVLITDANTGAILDERDIGDATHDYYQGSLAVNKFGQVVVGYDRSGRGADGKITFAARMFSTGATGQLTERGTEQVLKVSLVDDYHNNSTFNGVTCGLDGQVACGRQRWGDYSSVTLDPNDDRSFWAIGEYAREYNDAAGGHPGGTGGARWSTWISQLNSGTTVPEPATWAMMIGGFGFVGAAARRRRTGFATA